MNFRLRTRATAALMAAGLLAATTPVTAATLVQTLDFSQRHPLVSTDGNHGQLFELSDTLTTALHFDRFDPALGVLTAVQWQVRSTEDYRSGVSVGGVNGAAGLRFSEADTSVALGGVPLDPGSFVSFTEPLGCSVLIQSGCMSVAEAKAPYNFTVGAPDLAPFAQAGGLDLDLVSQILLTGIDPGDAAALVEFVGTLNWNGQVALTYDYTPGLPSPPPPAGVPEPATWALMLAGLGLAGAQLRARRRAFGASVGDARPEG